MSFRDLKAVDHGGAHLFNVLCQNKSCRQRLGGMHIPCAGGIVVVHCLRCGTVSRFKNGMYGIAADVMGKLKPVASGVEYDASAPLTPSSGE